MEDVPDFGFGDCEVLVFVFELAEIEFAFGGRTTLHEVLEAVEVNLSHLGVGFVVGCLFLCLSGQSRI